MTEPSTLTPPDPGLTVAGRSLPPGSVKYLSVAALGLFAGITVGLRIGRHLNAARAGQPTPCADCAGRQAVQVVRQQVPPPPANAADLAPTVTAPTAPVVGGEASAGPVFADPTPQGEGGLPPGSAPLTFSPMGSAG